MALANFALNHLRSHPEIYFGPLGFSHADLATKIALDALVLRSTSIGIHHVCDWWLVHSDQDWLEAKMPTNEIRNSFFRLIAFSELKMNFTMSHTLSTAFCADVATFCAASVHFEVISGNLSSEIRDACTSVCKQGRAIMFRGLFVV